MKKEEDDVIDVQGIDMIDGTPILDLEPFVRDKCSRPSYKEYQQS
ncbi:MAG: TrmO family methyltransferase [Desulfobacterales bacterium]|nr:TrmO family methyltransferase [Desulfobacterales bacterium]